jgi:predicted MFS family arabinose efflux permease
MALRQILTRDFVLSCFAQVAFSSVFFILIPTIPIYLQQIGTIKAGIGILVGALSVSSLILRPLIGRALLKGRERNFMIAGTLLFAISSGAYLIAEPFWPFFLVRVLQGIGLAFFTTSSFTLVARISPSAHRGQSLSYFYLAINIAFALAPSFGMTLINYFKFPVLFIVCVGLSLGSLFITLKLRHEEVDPSDSGAIKGQPLLSRNALPPAIMAFMGSSIWGAVTAFFPLYALQHGVSNPGLFFTVLAITLISARGFGGKILDLYSRERILLPCLVAQIIAMALLAFSSNLLMFFLVAVIWGLGNAFLYPTLVAYAIDLSGDSPGPAIGTYTAFSDFGAGSGAAIMGVILQLTNYPFMFLCLSFTGVLNLSYFYFFIIKGNKRYAHL